MGNIDELLNPPKFDWSTGKAIKSLKLFRSVLRTFSLTKFSSDAWVLATIDTEKFTFSEFLWHTGDFVEMTVCEKEYNEHWIRSIKNGVALRYKTICIYPNTEELTYHYVKWDEAYFDHFKGFLFPERYSILKEL